MKKQNLSIPSITKKMMKFKKILELKKTHPQMMIKIIVI